jgi:predicted nucleic acid-binding protein
MICGVDTTFLVHSEVREASGHELARKWLREQLAKGGQMALAPQALAEFVHVVTDPARFAAPVSLDLAVGRARDWWTAREVQQVHTTATTMTVFADWMREFRLGRERIPETLLAATYWSHGVRRIVTSNEQAFAIYGCFEVVDWRAAV